MSEAKELDRDEFFRTSSRRNNGRKTSTNRTTDSRSSRRRTSGNKAGEQKTAAQQGAAIQRETVVYSEQKPVSLRTIRVRRFLTSFGIFIFLLVCLWSSHRLREEAKELDRSILKLEQQIEEEKGKTLEYRVEQNYYKSDQYKEEMARNRFRLIFPGETLIQVN